MTLNENKTIYFLIGPKGCGKSTIGRLLEKRFGIRFPKMEALALDHIEEFGMPEGGLKRDGFDLEETLIHDILEKDGSVIFEATGSSVYFSSVLENLGNSYILKFVRLLCPLEICFERVKSRNPEGHHFVTDERIMEINIKASKVVLEWDLEIDNSKPELDQNIISQFASII